MERHKAINMKELQPHTPIWTNLKSMLHDLQKNLYRMILYLNKAKKEGKAKQYSIKKTYI